MTQEGVIFVEDADLLIVDAPQDVLFIEADRSGFVFTDGEKGPPGEAIAGGTAGQLLGIGDDGITREWVDPPESLPAGGTTGQVLTKRSGADGDAEWEDAAPGGVWGEITGDITTQADVMALAANLAAFAARHG